MSLVYVDQFGTGTRYDLEIKSQKVLRVNF